MPVTLEDIHSYWEDSAKTTRDKDGLKPTARDPFLQRVVEAAIEPWIKADASLLDVGCGDGDSTFRFLRKAQKALGVDYIESYVQRARRLAQDAGVLDIDFRQGDVLNLGPALKAETFDVAITIRCLINLPSWKLQQQGIQEITNALKPGGLFIVVVPYNNAFRRLVVNPALRLFYLIWKLRGKGLGFTEFRYTKAEMDGFLGFISLPPAQRLIGQGDALSQLAVVVDLDDDLNALRDQARAALSGGDIEVLTWQKAMPELYEYIVLDDAGMYVMIDVRSTGMDGKTFANRLLDAEGVSLLPGEGFGASGVGHVRFSTCESPDILAEACRRILRFAAEL